MQCLKIEIIQSNMNEGKTVMNFEINQLIETYANYPAQNYVLDYYQAD